ncbi:P-loop containing nucleoside triphosphate hydrolase, partial [Arabidopsis thaliana x Arabidopsis arenosa]
MDLSNKFVDYSKGHPFALKLLGSDLCQRDKLYWIRKLERLQRRPDGKIQEVLKMSYEELCPEEQSIFLDVACFFRSEKLDFVSRILSTYHIDAINVINDLIDKCLVMVSDNRLEMHDLLLTMGKEIGYESSIKEAGKRGRLWDQEDICRVLKYKTGTAEIRGIFMDMSNVESMKLSADIFTGMLSLKFLKFYNSHCSKWCENDCRFRFPGGLDCFPDELVYLHWQGYPLEYLPLNFNPKKLIDLSLRYSSIKQLWEYEKLECCISLAKCSSIRQMDSLVLLNLRDCINLKRLPKSINLKFLKVLILSGCSKLKKFPTISENIESLYLDGTAIKRVPESIESLRNLAVLNLKNCCKLMRLPYLDAHGCISLETVAKPMTLLVIAEKTHSTFVFTDCFKLNRDAQENIVAHTQLKSQILANGSLQRNHKVQVFRFYDFQELVLEPLAAVSFPGNDLPLWFRHQRMGSSMETHLPPHWCDDKFIGLSLCTVVSFKDYEDKTSRFSVICKCKFRNEDGNSISFTCNLGGWNESSGSSSHEEPRRLTSDHVFISYNNCFYAKKSHELNRCCNTTASFKFFVTDGKAKRKRDFCEVMKCGMSYLYAPDENDYRLQGLQENNLEKAVSAKETELNETALDEAAMTKRARLCLREEELLNRKRKKDDLISFSDHECSVTSVFSYV